MGFTFRAYVSKSTMRNGFMHIPRRIVRENGLKVGDILKIYAEKEGERISSKKEQEVE